MNAARVIAGLVLVLLSYSGPFVKLVSTAGSIGASIIILGNELSGASAVNFNGTAAVFTPGSDFYLTAVVPSGAATGNV
jgi:hypothetical protein